MSIHPAGVGARLHRLVAGALPAALLLACALVGLACLGQAVSWVGRPFPGFLAAHDGSVHGLSRRQWPRPAGWLLGPDGRPRRGAEVYARAAAARPGARLDWQVSAG